MSPASTNCSFSALSTHISALSTHLPPLPPQSAADRGGLLRAGDDLVALNGLVIVGWRAKSIVALARQITGPLHFLVRLSKPELDRRVSALMEHARALRDTMSASGRRSSLGPPSVDQASSHRSVSPARSPGITGRRYSGERRAARRESLYALSGAAAAPIAESTDDAPPKMEVSRPRKGDILPRGSTQSIEVGRGDGPGLRSCRARFCSFSTCRLTRSTTVSLLPLQWKIDMPQQGAPPIAIDLMLVNPRTGYSTAIAQNVLNNGLFVWKVPEDTPLRQDFQVLIASETTPPIRVLSAPFEIDVAAGSVGDGASVAEDLDSLRRVKMPKLRTVFLVPDDTGSLGFEVDGHFISDIHPGGPASRRNGLQLGDQIVEINGKQVQGWSHLGIINLLREHSAALELCVISNLEGYKTFLEGFEDLHEEYRQLLVCRQVEIPASTDDETEAFGLALLSSQDLVILASVMPDTPAAACKHMRPSTCLVHINGQPTFGAKSSDALLFLERSKGHPVGLWGDRGGAGDGVRVDARSISIPPTLPGDDPLCFVPLVPYPAPIFPFPLRPAEARCDSGPRHFWQLRQEDCRPAFRVLGAAGMRSPPPLSIASPAVCAVLSEAPSVQLVLLSFLAAPAPERDQENPCDAAAAQARVSEPPRVGTAQPGRRPEQHQQLRRHLEARERAAGQPGQLWTQARCPRPHLVL